jgi:hypothetical protein
MSKGVTPLDVLRLPEAVFFFVFFELTLISQQHPKLCDSQWANRGVGAIDHRTLKRKKQQGPQGRRAGK